MTKINVSEHLSQDVLAQKVLLEGFKTGASYVHIAAGVMLLMWGIEVLLYGLVKLKPELFKSQEAADEFYIRIRRGFDTGRFLIALFIFQKTVFTFTMTQAAPPGTVGP